MASINVEIDIEDYLDELSDDVLIRELRSRKTRTGAAERIINNIDPETLDTAYWHLRNGRYQDAVHYLESSLGREWAGAITRRWDA